MNKRDYEEIRKFKDIKALEQNKIYVEKKLLKVSIVTGLCGILALITVCGLITSRKQPINFADIISISIITYGIMSISQDILESNTKINSSKIHIEILEETIKDIENTFNKTDHTSKENNNDK